MAIAIEDQQRFLGRIIHECPRHDSNVQCFALNVHSGCSDAALSA